jgi:hypothetical protein
MGDGAQWDRARVPVDVAQDPAVRRNRGGPDCGFSCCALDAALAWGFQAPIC